MTSGSSSDARRLSPALVGPAGVVVLGVLVDDDAQVAAADDEHPIGAIGADVDTAFGVGAHLRALRRGPFDLDVLGGEDGVGRFGARGAPGDPESIAYFGRRSSRMSRGGWQVGWVTRCRLGPLSDRAAARCVRSWPG